MEKYINEILGLSIQKKQFNKIEKLPLYLQEEYNYNIYNIEGIDCIFVEENDF